MMMMDRTTELAGILMAADVAKNGLPNDGSPVVRETMQKVKVRLSFELAEQFLAEAQKRA